VSFSVLFFQAHREKVRERERKKIRVNMEKEGMNATGECKQKAVVIKEKTWRRCAGSIEHITVVTKERERESRSHIVKSNRSSFVNGMSKMDHKSSQKRKKKS
jgi:hypothetical protein